MRARYEQDPQNPKKINLSLTRDDGSVISLFLNNADPLNHIAATHTKAAEVVYRQANGTEESAPVDFTRLVSFEYPISAALPGRSAPAVWADSGVVPAGATVSFRHNGRWLGTDGWQESRQFMPVSETYADTVLETPVAQAPVVAPPPTPAEPKAKVCRNTLPDGTTCNTTNRLQAVVCYRCGSNQHFEPVY